MIINRYNLTTLEYIDQFDLSGLEGGDFYQLFDIGYGLSVDGTEKVYAVDYDDNQALRADIATLLGESLVGSSGSGDDNFYGPRYSAIVEYSSPTPDPLSACSDNYYRKGANSSDNLIKLYHYGDGEETTPTALKDIDPVAVDGEGIKTVVTPNSAGSNVFHSFKMTFNVNGCNEWFEPIYFGVNYSQDGRDR